ncbi:MAG TPA: hypothetical protein VGB45_12320 [Abditibacterium sp.]|jgi:hypothetical protein
MKRLIPIILVFAYAIFVFHGFGSAFPPGLNHDGAQHGLFALRILNGESLGIYTPEAFGHETGFYYVMAAVFRLLGATKETLELTATIFGALSVGLFYWILKRKTQNAWFALALSLLWISSSALVLYSRVGWQLITLVPAALWVAASCRFYFDNPDRARFWALQIGLSAGATLYTYNGGRAILAFVPLFWIFRLIQTRFERKVCLNAALSLAVFAVVCAPMLFYAANHPQEWNGRASALLGQTGGLAGKWANLSGALGYFNFSAQGDDFFTNFPVLEGPMLILWASGIGFALFRFRNYWPELLLFAVFLLPSIATKPSFHRAIGTLPIVFLLACYFLIAALRKLPKRAFQPVLAILVALQIGAGWKKLYIDAQPFAWGFYPETTVVGRYLGAHSDQNFTLYAGNWPQDALYFLSQKDFRPGANFTHYQGYNSPSGDGLPEILLALSQNSIARPARFIVDEAKADAFLSATKPLYSVENEGELKRNDVVVARVFKVK